MDSKLRSVSFMVSLGLALAFCLGNAQAQSQISTNVDDLKFYYFTTPTDGVEIVYNNGASLSSSNLKAAVPTVIIIDGFLSNLTTPMSQNVKNAYVENGGDNLNVIVLDWGRLSGSGISLSNILVTLSSYQTVMGNVAQIGQRVADFINFLQINKQIQFSDVSVIGHSLGAHVAGDVGKAVKNTYGGLLARIAGLDPAGPLYHLQLVPSLRLDRNDAAFVDIYHSNRGVLGIIDDIGQANIYLNGGTSQPGCTTEDITGVKGFCSHSYSWQFFISAFQTDYTACPCLGLVVSCVCLNCNSCSNGIPVGPNMPFGASGLFSASAGSFA